MKVHVVGAGPGDPELITVKGLRLIAEADIVVLDRLVPKELGGEKSVPISSLQDPVRFMAVNAREGRKVVWLKNGDPSVFGRLLEVCAELSQWGVQCEVVPGDSSAIAVPELFGIPLTLPGVHSFTVLTAVKRGREALSSKEIPRCGTLVILMGLGVIGHLKRELLKVRDPDEGVAVLSWSGESRMEAVGNLRDLDRLSSGFKPPAVIVVGEGVKKRVPFAVEEPSLNERSCLRANSVMGD